MIRMYPMIKGVDSKDVGYANRMLHTHDWCMPEEVPDAADWGEDDCLYLLVKGQSAQDNGVCYFMFKGRYENGIFLAQDPDSETFVPYEITLWSSDWRHAFPDEICNVYEETGHLLNITEDQIDLLSAVMRWDEHGAEYFPGKYLERYPFKADLEVTNGRTEDVC